MTRHMPRSAVLCYGCSQNPTRWGVPFSRLGPPMYGGVLIRTGQLLITTQSRLTSPASFRNLTNHAFDGLLNQILSIVFKDFIYVF